MSLFLVHPNLSFSGWGLSNNTPLNVRLIQVDSMMYLKNVIKKIKSDAYCFQKTEQRIEGYTTKILGRELSIFLNNFASDIGYTFQQKYFNSKIQLKNNSSFYYKA